MESTGNSIYERQARELERLRDCLFFVRMVKAALFAFFLFAPFSSALAFPILAGFSLLSLDVLFDRLAGNVRGVLRRMGRTRESYRGSGEPVWNFVYTLLYLSALHLLRP